MPQHGREYRMILGLKHHQCTACGVWKESNAENFQRSGQGGVSYRGRCRPCQSANLPVQDTSSAERNNAMALATRAIDEARRRASLLAHYKRPAEPIITDSYAPSIFDISTAPPIGFLFADFDQTRGLRFDPVDPD